MAHAGGRPVVFESVEILQDKIDAYFKYCDHNHKPYTDSGLASFLEVTRQTLLNYTEKDEFFVTIKKAKTKIEAQYEERAVLGEYNPTISIFIMKNNFGYEDKVQQEVKVTERSKAEKLSDELFGD